MCIWFTQGAKILVRGDTEAFLSGYGVMSAVGLRAHQLDRSGGLQDDSTQAEHISKASSHCSHISPCNNAFLQTKSLETLPEGFVAFI